jgi:rhamnogalacturonan hydrolase
MQTWVTLASGTNWAFRLDGFITRTGSPCRHEHLSFYTDNSQATTSGHMIVVLNANDFEFYSANSKGGIQGNGYQCRNAG